MADVSVEWYGHDIDTINTRAARAGLKLAMEHLLGVSNELVPIEEGTLMRSGTAEVDDAELIGIVTYSARNDRDDYDYAVRQHEDLTLDHAPGRQAKFLEEPLFEEADTMMEIVAERIRRANDG